MTYGLPNASPEESFADCDEDTFAIGFKAGDNEWIGGGAGQIDWLWILDVNGSIVILDALLSLATPSDLVEKTRTFAESATFKLP